MLNQTVTLPVTVDNSIVMVDGEWDQNAGQQGRIPIKGNQHVVAMAFDMSAIVGRRVRKATLVCTQGEQQIAGISVSTIAAPWDENRSSGITAGIEGTDALGLHGRKIPCGQRRQWVHAGLAGGLPFFVTASITGMFLPDMVHAMADGRRATVLPFMNTMQTMAVIRPFLRMNSRAESRTFWWNSNEQPEPAPEPAKDLEISSADSSSARLTLTAPASGFAYEVHAEWSAAWSA